MPSSKVEAFVAKHADWIERAQERIEKRKPRLPKEQLPRIRRNSKAYKEAQEQARTLVTARLIHFNKVYNFTYGTISIRNQKTRWGSCSAKGNLSFNYRIAFLPPELADYIIVHELCHTKEHNHSPRFWVEVARTIPNYLALRNQLRTYRF
ncbi:MAG: putative metal-dependent hydrolase [Parcubacteria group bacterium]|nr:putative metal-dependent hydrolase [Parcubacteria group bacterium]